MIPFNVPPCTGDELEYIRQAISSHKICGDGEFTKKCSRWMEDRFHAQKALFAGLCLAFFFASLSRETR